MFSIRRNMMAASNGRIINLSAISVSGGTNYSGNYSLNSAPITLSKPGSYLLIPQKSFKMYVMGSAGGGAGSVVNFSETVAGGGGGGGEHVLATEGSGFELSLTALAEYTLYVGGPGGATYITDSNPTNIFYLYPGGAASGQTAGAAGSGGNGTSGGAGGTGGEDSVYGSGDGQAGTTNGGGGGGGYGRPSPFDYGGNGGNGGSGTGGYAGAGTPGTPSYATRISTGVPLLAQGGSAGEEAYHGGGGGGSKLDFYRAETIRLDGTHSGAGGGGGGGGADNWDSTGGGPGGGGILVLDSVA